MNTRMKVVAIFVFALVALSSFGPLSHRASAMSVMKFDRHGGVTWGRIVGSHIPQGIFVNEGTVLTRSKATSGLQKVYSQFTVYQAISGRWERVYTSPLCVSTIRAGTNSVKPCTLMFEPRSGYYIVGLAVTWYDANGRYLGALSGQTNLNSDYLCRSRVVGGCSIQGGYIWLSRS